MTTECTQESFRFHALFGRQVRVAFDGGTITSFETGCSVKGDVAS